MLPFLIGDSFGGLQAAQQNEQAALDRIALTDAASRNQANAQSAQYQWGAEQAAADARRLAANMAWQQRAQDEAAKRNLYEFGVRSRAAERDFQQGERRLGLDERRLKANEKLAETDIADTKYAENFDLAKRLASIGALEADTAEALAKFVPGIKPQHAAFLETLNNRAKGDVATRAENYAATLNSESDIEGRISAIKQFAKDNKWDQSQTTAKTQELVADLKKLRTEVLPAIRKDRELMKIITQDATGRWVVAGAPRVQSQPQVQVAPAPAVTAPVAPVPTPVTAAPSAAPYNFNRAAMTGNMGGGYIPQPAPTTGLPQIGAQRVGRFVVQPL